MAARIPKDPTPTAKRARITVQWFSSIYLGGIPPIITNDSAFLAFICCVTAVEALSGYRYGDENLNRRFVRFVNAYFPTEYHRHADDLYTLRKKLVHAFSTGPFRLMHHRSDLHLKTALQGGTVLNAEDLYAALLIAAQKYFSELDARIELQETLVRRLDSEGGGSITVGPVSFAG